MCVCARVFLIYLSIFPLSKNPMRLRSVLERQVGEGVVWSGVSGKVHVCVCVCRYYIIGGVSILEQKHACTELTQRHTVAEVTFSCKFCDFDVCV